MTKITSARLVALAASCVSVFACGAPAPVSTSPAARSASSALYDPARDLGPLFHDIQLARVYPDSKTLVDAKPLGAPSDIVARYAAVKGSPGFDIKAFKIGRAHV